METQIIPSSEPLGLLPLGDFKRSYSSLLNNETWQMNYVDKRTRCLNTDDNTNEYLLMTSYEPRPGAKGSIRGHVTTSPL